MSKSSKRTMKSSKRTMKSSKLQFEGSGADVDSMEGFGALLDPFLDRGFFGARQSDEELTKKLKRVCGVLSQIEDCNARDVEEKRKVCRLAGSIAKSQIYRHENSEVRAFAACVVVELSRFVDNPFAEEKTVSDMLDFLIDQLQGIVDSASSLFPLYFHIIEIISARSLFLLILELSNSEKKNALLTKLFSSLLQISGKNLIPKVKQYVQDIIQNTIMEPEIEVTRDILITILEFLSPDTKENSFKSFEMCKSILSHCENRLTNSVVDVLYQLPSMRRISLGKPSNYAHLICELASTTPSIVTCLVPKLQSMLTSDDVQVRSQYVALFGKILSIENSKLPMKFLLDSFLKRFLDIDAKIRLEAIAISGDIYHVQISSSADILEALQQRLYDIDDKVRKQVILILCNIFERNSDNFDGEIIVDMAKRMMDKSLSVRHAAITSISDLYNSLVSRSLSIRNSLKSIPVQILKLMQQESTATLAEQIFDEKILLGANIDLCARTNQLAFVYGSLEEDFRKFFVQKFIRDKKSISKEIFEVLEKPQESFEKVSPLLFKISLKLGLCISKEFNEVELTGLHKLLCHKDRKVRKWIETLGNVKADYEDQRTCQNEIRRLGRLDKSMQKVTEALSVRLPSFVFSAANIAELLELIRGLLEAGDRLGITIMLTLLKEFANEYKGVLDFFLLDLKALLKNASNDEIAGLILDLIGTCSLREPSEDRELEAELRSLVRRGNEVVASSAAQSILNIFTNPNDILEDVILSFCDEVSLNMPNLLPALSVLSKVSDIKFALFEKVDEKVFFFILEDILSLKEFPSNDQDGFSTAQAYGLELLVNFGFSKLASNKSEGVSWMKRLLETIIRIVQENLQQSSRIPLLLKCINCILKIAGSRISDLTLAPYDFLTFSLVSFHRKDLVREAFMDSIWKAASRNQISFQYCILLSFSALDSNEKLRKKGKSYIQKLVEFKRKVLEVALTRNNAGDKVSYRHFPEYFLAYVVFLTANNPLFDGSLESCYHILPVVELFLSSLLTKQHQHNFNLICAILDAVRKSDDHSHDEEKTKRCYMVVEIMQQVISKHFHGKEWKDSTYPEQIKLPSEFFHNRKGMIVDTQQYLYKDFSLDKRHQHALLRHSHDLLDLVRKDVSLTKDANREDSSILSESVEEKSETRQKQKKSPAQKRKTPNSNAAMKEEKIAKDSKRKARRYSVSSSSDICPEVEMINGETDSSKAMDSSDNSTTRDEKSFDENASISANSMSPKKTLIQEKSRKKRPLGKKRTTRSVSACISDDGSSSELSELGPLDVPASPIRTRRRQVQRH